MELLASVASRVLKDNRTVMVGTGLPLIAALLAQRRHAPGLTMFFEAGGIGARPSMLPISVGESRTFQKGVQAASMHNTMSNGQAGFVDYGFLGGAQIDRYGNLNSTVIGNWQNPQVRFPGSGGANDIGSWAWETIIIMKQDEKKFVNKLDFVTTPGYLSGPGTREKEGLPENTGPYRVVTQLATYGFDEDTKRMKLLALNPGVTVTEVQNNSSFEILIPPNPEKALPPKEGEKRILHEVDPHGVVLEKG